ncbi:unnamed protein product [Triticum aestivum]|uniref:GRF-type domain-containing protein n=1 Tax=Triticum aestivum TaxID=4565 RepID=A0A7H4LH73_WHEAT|nr:unnamed protein product [Triticum aestivum]
MKLTYPTFASPLLYLLCLALEALAAATMSVGCSSTCSSAGNNQICAKSLPAPSPVGLITPPSARTPQPVAHRNPLLFVWCHCCKSRRVIRRVSTTILNPGRVFYKCPNHGKREDSCDLYFWKLLMWGSATTLLIWLVEESQYQQVGVLDK